MSLPHISSDHHLIALSLELAKKKRSPFKFENMWITHKDFKDKLKEWWEVKIHGTTMYKLTKKLDEVRRNLKIWNKKEFKSIYYRKNFLKRRIEEVEKEALIKGRSEELDKEERKILVEYHSTLTQEEKMWR